VAGAGRQRRRAYKGDTVTPLNDIPVMLLGLITEIFPSSQ
jgi:hypothetical protein